MVVYLCIPLLIFHSVCRYMSYTCTTDQLTLGSVSLWMSLATLDACSEHDRPLNSASSAVTNSVTRPWSSR